jgi:hypothetical protein
MQLQLDARLAQGGAIKMRDIEGALIRQKAGANRIAQTLIAELMATETSMEKDLRALSHECLRDLATWTAGTFTVYDGVIPPPWAHTITPDFPALLVEALRGQCQKEALQKEFVSRKGILRARSGAATSAALSDAERSILALVTGERTIEEIVKRSGLDELQALGAMHVLCALHLTDLLPPQRGGKAPGEKAAAGPAPAQAQQNGSPDRGGSTDKYAPQAGDVKKPIAAAEVTPKVPEPAVRTGDSTAKLRAIPDIALPKAPTRVLRVVAEDRTEEVVLVSNTFAVGRHPRNDLVLKDPRISSFHCRVEVEGDRCVLLDLKSRNGTLLNSARIDRSVLKPNDQIQLGSTKITYLET